MNFYISLLYQHYHFTHFFFPYLFDAADCYLGTLGSSAINFSLEGSTLFGLVCLILDTLLSFLLSLGFEN
jgi:hypothetical protein